MRARALSRSGVACNQRTADRRFRCTVSRLVCKSENYEMELTLDVNVELLPVEKEFKFSVELATTLNLDGTPDSGCYEQGQEKSAGNRLSSCDYAMHGKVFKYDNMSDNKVYAPRRALAARPPHWLMHLVAT